MSNIGKVRIHGKIKKYSSLPLLKTDHFLNEMEFPKHIWLSYSKKKDRWIINTYIDPRFDKPKSSEEPDYWMEYKGTFDTPEGLLHQIKHMCGKGWYTRQMVDETMDAVNWLHKKLTNKQHWFWIYPKDKEMEIINDD